MGAPRNPPPQSPTDGVKIAPGELTALLLQSMLLAASLGFTATVFAARIAAVPRGIAFGIGLELGLLVSYPTMRIVARANGATLGPGRWIAITLVPAVLAVTIVSVL